MGDPRELVSLADFARPAAACEPVPGFAAWLTDEGQAEMRARYPDETRRADFKGAWIVSAVLSRTAVVHSPDDQTTRLVMRHDAFLVDSATVAVRPRADLEARERSRRGREGRRSTSTSAPDLRIMQIHAEALRLRPPYSIIAQRLASLLLQKAQRPLPLEERIRELEELMALLRAADGQADAGVA